MGAATTRTHVYVTRTSCGCWAVMIADLGHNWTAESVADEITRGRTVERVTIAEAHAILHAEGRGPCEHSR